MTWTPRSTTFGNERKAVLMVLVRGEEMICVICCKSSNDSAEFLHCILPVAEMSGSVVSRLTFLSITYGAY